MQGKQNKGYEQTPYQGKKRVYGHYMCELCMRKWESAGSWANCSQECKRCHIEVLPYKQYKLKNKKTYICVKCNYNWIIFKKKEKKAKHEKVSDASLMEKCPKCGTLTSPIKETPKQTRPHKESLCEKCQELGSYCLNLEEDEVTYKNRFNYGGRGATRRRGGYRGAQRRASWGRSRGFRRFKGYYS